MLNAAHTLVAGYIGERIGNPFLAFLVGFLIHFILDSVPHYDTTDKGKFTVRQVALVALDGVIAIVILYHILSLNHYNQSFIAGAVGGIMPDLLDNVPFWQKQLRSTKFGSTLHRIHTRVHGKQPPFWLGFLTQAIFIAVFYWLSLKLIH